MKKRYVVLIVLVAWLPFFIGAWDKDKPSATTSLRSSNPELLANNAALEAALNREHEYSTGGTTADQAHHRPGSARAYFQDTAPSTRADGSTAFTSTDLGSLWFDTNATPDNLAYVLTATTPTWTLKSTSTIAEMVAAAHTWSGHQTLAAGYDLLGSTTSDINFGSGNFTVAGATGNTSVGGTFESVGIATLADASVTKTSGAPTADAQIANKKYVDDQLAFSAYTDEDSNTDAMLKAHAYKAATDGYVSAYVTQTNNDEPIKGYVNTSGNPADSENNLIKQSSDSGSGAIKSIGFWVAKDEYFEITQATDTPVIKWKSRGTLSKPVDNN